MSRRNLVPLPARRPRVEAQAVNCTGIVDAINFKKGVKIRNGHPYFAGFDSLHLGQGPAQLLGNVALA